MVAGFDARVSHLEAKVEAHSESINGIRDAIVHLEQRIDVRFQGLEQRFQAFEQRFQGLDQRIQGFEQRFQGLDQRFQGFDQQFLSLDDKMSRQFLWLVGMQMTTLATVVAALIAALK